MNHSSSKYVKTRLLIDAVLEKQDIDQESDLKWELS